VRDDTQLVAEPSEALLDGISASQLGKRAMEAATAAVALP